MRAAGLTFHPDLCEEVFSMKKVVFAILALLVLSAFPSFAQAPTQPSADDLLQQIFSAPAAEAAAMTSPMDQALFVDDAADVAYSTCCTTFNVACQANCKGSVCRGVCTRTFSGCSFECVCC
jgi:hypothetical protein